MAEPTLPQKFSEYLEKCPHVSKSLEKFMEEHCHLFAVGADEHKLNYMELYNQYVALVEQRMGEFLRHADLTEEKFAEALSTAVAADDPGMDPLMAWLNKTEFSHFAATMKNKHLAMKQLGADEQVVFEDSDEDEAA
mmetsp:Transcript_12870/g.24465  ORF Transcript_12870/g.24465 Transcript_12870/m.24465 type:complete len:137 (+) Transcript_12870:156-566(+)|eukprot:CAMPEP_0114225002 /NCGR_PEP_ID=MMETSP0058-20121206/420_1 /TAXON_ID=36894 /ORGANISM="Pyramimonas parkeae, CCMP726" /LENGTH=136 /DNA_ID=CAMNT_0001335539 /DNA_START=135 /DNA_END=545 /DNA_ORIENTATION=+